ncbi:Response regulator [Rhodovastum atsumiense]|uniref:Response regulator n=1 Tax=Rhodovastum atsumiense TaxID=504468 RepID=A0A5M6IUT0_9PROT|nr:response regulator [Rhodovastum atsumiense]KAA5611165.1 response regulator [Rhodovastum atsumiense]CAH2602529.1 Response regulator [Rhodovastum atsumiense]
MASILLIEDVPAVLLSLRLILQGKGHQVTDATNGAEAVELLRVTRFDLVITDIWMAGASGVDVIREGRRHSPPTRFLGITGGNPNVSGQVEEPHPDRYGADLLLRKPFKREALLSAVEQLLRPS